MTRAGGSALRGRRVLVSGAAGFVGRHLCVRLAHEGADVTALTRRTCDLTDRRAVAGVVRRAQPDAVLHLAAARQAGSSSQRADTGLVNTMAGAWLVESVPDTCRAVVRLGSSTEYQASRHPMDEQTPVAPRSFFGATKAAGSLVFDATAEERAIRSCALRAFQVYGPGDKPTRLVPTVLAAAASGARLALTRPGLRRDWVWVGDVVQACVLAVVDDDLPAGSVFNLGTGVQTTNEALVATAERVTGRRIATVVGAHPGRAWDTGDWVCDPSAARTGLHWKAEVDLAEGLARCWAAA